MFFQVTRDGKPIQKRRYFFSETFAAIGCAEYAKASGNAHAMEIAKKTFSLAVDLYRNPDKYPSKYYKDTVAMKSLSVPMIILSTAQGMRNIEKLPLYDEIIDELMEVIFRDFMKKEHKALFENVGLNGEKLDSPKGRCINPGHSIETAWFLMNEGIYRYKRMDAIKF